MILGARGEQLDKLSAFQSLQSNNVLLYDAPLWSARVADSTCAQMNLPFFHAKNLHLTVQHGALDV